jgi:hypothetical protein
MMVWVGGLVGLFVVDRLLLAAEGRGFVYYRKVKARGAAGAALAELHSFVEPHADEVVVVMEQQREREDTDDAGDGGPTPHGTVRQPR